MADTCLRRLRSWASTAMCPIRASQTAVFVLEGDPTVSVATAVATRWAKEVWSSAFDLRAISLPQLQAIFAATAGVRHIRGWSSCRGPVSAIVLELRRIGWGWPSATTFQDGQGEIVDLLRAPLAKLKVLFCNARARQLRRLLADKAELTHPIDPTPVQHVLRSRHLLDARQKIALKRSFQDAIFCRDRLEACGYELPSTTCPLCCDDGGSGPADSLRHRMFECTHPDVVAIRSDIFPRATCTS